jgi:hypothetical protein
MRPSSFLRPVLLSAIGAWLASASLASAQVPTPTPSAEPPPIEPVPIEPPPPVEAPPPMEAFPTEERAPVESAPTTEIDTPSALHLEAAVGVGVRAELVFDPKRNEPQDSPVYTLNHDLRPYFHGQVHEYVKFEANLDSNGENMVVLDAIVKLEFNDYFNVWAGRFLPPSDRANLSGPYFQNAWTYPSGVNAYPSVYAGRNDGIAIWGQLNGGLLKWQLGAFDMGGGTPDPLIAARITLNLLDPEPGYYNSSTYYGSKDVLAIGGSIQHKPEPDDAPEELADTLWNLDALFEKSFARAGTLDIEGAFYGFDGSDNGTSFFALASFMIEPIVGIGRLQPMVRFQRAGWGAGDSFPAFGTAFVPPADASLITFDAGLNYIIDGHNARLAFTFSHTSLDVDVPRFDAATDDVFILGGQIQAF